MRPARIVVAMALVGLAACSTSAARDNGPSPLPIPSSATASASGPRSNPLPPLTGLPWLARLFETRGSEDVVTLPLGATEPRPVIVAVHGAGDRPDWACGGWRIGVESYAFVVCPAGLAMGQSRYGWGSSRDIDAAVARALTEARRRFPQHMATGPMVYAGFSQGANLASPYLIANAQRFPVVVLAEGGYDYLRNPDFALRYHDAGGKRILLLCGTPACMLSAKHAEAVLTRAHLEVTVAGDVKAGHNLNTPMQNALRRDFPKLVADAPEWATFAAHRWTD